MVFVPTSKSSLQAAIALWIDDSSATADSGVPSGEGTGLYGDINGWNVAAVIDMSYLFINTLINSDISGWDVSNVVTMKKMFWNTSNYNNGSVSLNSWNTSNVESMEGMFGQSTNFNQPIGDWNVSKVVNMESMFKQVYHFNQDITGWDMKTVTKMAGMFENASVFNQNLTLWELGTADFTNRHMFFHAYQMMDEYSDDPYFNITPTHAFFRGPTVIEVPAGPPPAPICFPAGTPVTTDQGQVAIEKLNTDKHTIRGKEIVAITQSRPLQKHIVCFEKDSLSKNVPSQQTLCSKNHAIFYNGEMTKARNIVDMCENVTLVDYNGETLFNVLLKKHDKMMINNLICETLHPENIMAKISTMKNGQKKNTAIRELTKIIKENNVPEYQKLYASL